MSEDTLVVFGSGGRWRDIAEMDDYDFVQAITATTQNHRPLEHMRRIPRPIWEHWQRTKAEFSAADAAIYCAPQLDISALRCALATAAPGESPCYSFPDE